MNIAAIVAGGSGTRMGTGGLPKQFLPLVGRPVLIHTAERFFRHPEIDGIVIGMNPVWLQYAQELLARYFPEDAGIAVVPGGASRHDTLARLVEAAKERFSLQEEDILVTHDAVRPFVTDRMISENIRAARQYGVAGTYIPATDTVVCSQDGETLSGMPDRAGMYQAQTPQSFRLGSFERAAAELREDELSQVTDACKLFFLRNCPVHMVAGEITNLKITHPLDYQVAKKIVEDFGGTNEPDVECRADAGD